MLSYLNSLSFAVKYLETIKLDALDAFSSVRISTLAWPYASDASRAHENG